jgi:hypothetical protein
MLVSLGQLERQLLAIALWDLSQSRRIEMVIGDRPTHKVRSPSHPLLSSPFLFRFRRLQASTPSGFLERLLFDLMDSDAADLYELVVQRWPMDGYAHLPMNGVIVLAQREALTAGLLHRSTKSPVRARCLRWSEPLAHLDADRSKIAECESALTDLASRLRSYTSQAPAVWNGLINERERSGFSIWSCSMGRAKGQV